jgi:hypothetical protein
VRPAQRSWIGRFAPVLLAVLVVGCGSTPSDSTPTTPIGPTPSYVTSERGKPIGPPPKEESIADAERRLTATAASGDCERINDLAPLSIVDYVDDTEEYCSSIESLAEFEVSDIAAYQGLGGVIDYSGEGEDQMVSAILVRDSDGLFHVAFPASTGTPTVGTPFATQFDAAANRAVKALGERDCEAFLKVANRESGIGSTDATEACISGEAIEIAAAVFGSRKPRPVRLGGNGYFAFYGLDSPEVYLTIVERRTTEPQTADESSAPKYVYVASYVTNRRDVPSQYPGGSSSGAASTTSHPTPEGQAPD